MDDNTPKTTGLNDQLEVYEVVKIPSLARLTIRELVNDKLALVSLFIIVSIFIMVVLGSFFIGTTTATRIDIWNVFAAPSWTAAGDSDANLLLGTEGGGRNVFYLLVIGARNSLIIGLVVATVALTVGFVVGIFSGFYGGHFDNVVMRLMDTFGMLPGLLVQMMLIQQLDRTIVNLIFVLSIFAWMGTARSIRNITLSVRNQDYIHASKAMGTSNIVIMFREVVPNIMPVLAPSVVLGIAGTIGVEAGLALLGFGLPIGTPSIGTLIQNATVFANLQFRWWTWAPAIGLLFLISVSLNFVGQVISRVADPRQRRV